MCKQCPILAPTQSLRWAGKPQLPGLFLKCSPLHTTAHMTTTILRTILPAPIRSPHPPALPLLSITHQYNTWGGWRDGKKKATVNNTAFSLMPPLSSWCFVDTRHPVVRRRLVRFPQSTHVGSWQACLFWTSSSWSFLHTPCCVASVLLKSLCTLTKCHRVHFHATHYSSFLPPFLFFLLAPLFFFRLTKHGWRCSSRPNLEALVGWYVSLWFHSSLWWGGWNFFSMRFFVVFFIQQHYLHWTPCIFSCSFHVIEHPIIIPRYPLTCPILSFRLSTTTTTTIPLDNDRSQITTIITTTTTLTTSPTLPHTHTLPPHPNNRWWCCR